MIKNFTITKRDGSKEVFSLDKIMNAIVKAFQSVHETPSLNSISKLISHLDIHEGITVEDIQNSKAKTAIINYYQQIIFLENFPVSKKKKFYL